MVRVGHILTVGHTDMQDFREVHTLTPHLPACRPAGGRSTNYNNPRSLTTDSRDTGTAQYLLPYPKLCYRIRRGQGA